jgi:hypothetical protein
MGLLMLKKILAPLGRRIGNKTISRQEKKKPTVLPQWVDLMPN